MLSQSSKRQTASPLYFVSAFIASIVSIDKAFLPVLRSRSLSLSAIFEFRIAIQREEHQLSSLYSDFAKIPEAIT